MRFSVSLCMILAHLAFRSHATTLTLINASDGDCLLVIQEVPPNLHQVLNLCQCIKPWGLNSLRNKKNECRPQMSTQITLTSLGYAHFYVEFDQQSRQLKAKPKFGKILKWPLHWDQIKFDFTYNCLTANNQEPLKFGSERQCISEDSDSNTTLQPNPYYEYNQRPTTEVDPTPAKKNQPLRGISDTSQTNIIPVNRDTSIAALPDEDLRTNEGTGNVDNIFDDPDDS